MSLYTDWSDYVVDYIQQKGEPAFWQEYGAIEKSIYTKVLGEYGNKLSGTVSALAEKCGTEPVYFMGFLDGINTSLVKELDLESLDTESEIELDIDFAKLYFNMLEAKADYLYELPQWDSIFSKEKRKEIHREWAASRTAVKQNTVGRNEPCPCGSGKKYKKCCGKNA